MSNLPTILKKKSTLLTLKSRTGTAPVGSRNLEPGIIKSRDGYGTGGEIGEVLGASALSELLFTGWLAD